MRDSEGNPVISRLDGELLREIALATDGAYVPAGTGVLDLASIYETHIARLTRGQLDSRGRSIRGEIYQAFVAAALSVSSSARRRAAVAGAGSDRRSGHRSRAGPSRLRGRGGLGAPPCSSLAPRGRRRASFSRSPRPSCSCGRALGRSPPSTRATSRPRLRVRSRAGRCAGRSVRNRVGDRVDARRRRGSAHPLQPRERKARRRATRPREHALSRGAPRRRRRSRAALCGELQPRHGGGGPGRRRPGDQLQRGPRPASRGGGLVPRGLGDAARRSPIRATTST